MSNPTNRFQEGLTYSQWLDAYGDLIQGKFDKPGGAVPPEGTNLRAGAEWANTVDDLMLTIAQFGVATTPQFEYHENTGSPISIPALDGATNEAFDFTFDITTNRTAFELMWVSLTRDVDNTPIPPPALITISIDNTYSERTIAQFNTRDSKGLSVPGAGQAYDFAASTGVLMAGPFGQVPEEPVVGTRRFYVRVQNASETSTDTVLSRFCYVIRAFDLSLTELPQRTINLPS